MVMVTSRILQRTLDGYVGYKQRCLHNLLNQSRFFTSTTIQHSKTTIITHRTHSLNSADVLGNNSYAFNLDYKKNSNWASSADIKKLEFLLEMNSTNDCLHLLKLLDGKTVQDKHITQLILKLLKEDRMEETWYFIQKYSKWNLWRLKIFMNYLDDTNQQYYIIPLAHLARQQNISSNSAAWRLILQNRISSFQSANDYNWWFLSKFLVRVSGSLFEKNFFYDRLKKFLAYAGENNMAFFDRPDSQLETELYSIIKSSYLFSSNSNAPKFNLNFSNEKLLSVYKLFNPQIESPDVLTLKTLLQEGKKEEAINKLKSLETINRFHVLPFIKNFSETQDLLGLNNFIKLVEESYDLKISFMALSEYASRLLTALPEKLNNVEDQANLKKNLTIVLKYLNQQTSINSSIWSKNFVEKLNADLDSNLETLEKVSFADLEPAALYLQKL